MEEMRSEFISLLAREDAASSCTESRVKPWTLLSVSFAGIMWREEAGTEFNGNKQKEGIACPMIRKIMERFPGIGCAWMNAAGKESAVYFGAADAYDLWIPATENYRRIRDSHLEDRVIPIHGDAMDMPFAHEYFDVIVSVDAYHYFGCREGVFAEKILPFVKPGGYVMIAVPGLKAQPKGDLRQLFETWAEGDDVQLFKTAAWWEALLKNECGDKCEITVKEAECFDIAWQEWFDTGHEYGIRDREFLQKGLDRILNFVLIYVRRK